MDIREIADLDVEEYTQLYVSVFNAKPWNENWSLESSFARLDCYRRTPNFIGFSAHDGCEVIGFVLGNVEPYQQGSVFILKEMCVQTNCQRAGVGTKLLEHLHYELKKRKICVINLLTRVGQPAEAFYLKNGYTRSSRVGLYIAKINT